VPLYEADASLQIDNRDARRRNKEIAREISTNVTILSCTFECRLFACDTLATFYQMSELAQMLEQFKGLNILIFFLLFTTELK